MAYTKIFPQSMSELCPIKDKTKQNMPNYPATALLSNLHQVVENALQTIIAEWQNLPEAVLAQAPGPKSWSAAQCLDHLNRYYRYYVPAFAQSIAKAEQMGQPPATEFHSTWLGNLSVKAMLTNEKGHALNKMQAMKDYRPSLDLDVRAIVAEFIDHQEQLLQLLERAMKVDLNRAKVSISIAQFLKLRLGDALMFVVSHQCRHLLQAQRAARVAGGPAITFPRFDLAQIGQPATQSKFIATT